MANTHSGALLRARCMAISLSVFATLAACAEKKKEPGAIATANIAEGTPGSDRVAANDSDTVQGRFLDACDVLPKADLERILGVSYQDGAVSGGATTFMCRYLDANQRQLVSIDVHTKRAQANMEGMLNALSNEQEIPDIDADAAYTAGYGAIYLLKGDVFVKVLAQTADVTPSKVQELATIVARNLSR